MCTKLNKNWIWESLFWTQTVAQLVDLLNSYFKMRVCLDDHMMQTDFIISLVRDSDMKQKILQSTQNLNIPTIQV